MDTSFDERLVALLREDGRASLVWLAHELKVPRAVVRQRLRALRENGDLAITAIVHPAVLGLDVGGHLSIKVDGDADPIVAQLLANADVTLVSMVSGPYAIIAEVRARNHRQFFDTVEEIRLAPHVAEVHTLTYVDILRSPFRVAERPPRISLDDVDRALLRALQEDGRMPYRSLAEATGVSESTARARTRALLQHGVIRITTIPRRNTTTRSLAMGVGMSLRGYSEDLIADLLELNGVEFLATSLGSHDLVCTVSATSLPALQRTVDTIRRSPDVTSLSTWVHMDFVRETYHLSVG